MRQLFFISPTGYQAVREAFMPRVRGASTHGGCAEGDDGAKDTVIGVVEMDGRCDAEKVIDALESKGILWLPDHKTGEKIKPEHYEALKKHGVLADHSTLEAMQAVH